MRTLDRLRKPSLSPLSFPHVSGGNPAGAFRTADKDIRGRQAFLR
jgi:hypothetical protein